MPPQRRLVRRQPLSEKVKAWLNILDFGLWLSEELETRDWDSKTVGTQLGLIASFLFLIARANSGRSSTRSDDVFGESSGSGWGTFFFQPLLWFLVCASAANAFYVLTRSRHYRLFETNVENTKLSTPSARRVRVDSSPAASSPLRYLSDILASESAESRAHPDKTRDVWEISVWDPRPISLHFFIFFSPVHVIVYMLFLPLVALDPRPSVTVFKCLLLQIILSMQLYLLESRFAQQAKDTSIIQREVMHEYDAKFVHPRLHPLVREVGTQVSISDEGLEQEDVEVGTPTTILRRGFQTHPNPNYAKHYDPDYTGQPKPRNVMNPSLFTPATKPRYSDAFTSGRSIQSSALRQHTPGARQSLPPSSTPSNSTGVPAQQGTPSTPGANHNFGGSLGVYSHSLSPLKKATSMGDLKGSEVASPRNSREMAALEQRDLADRMVRQSSPLKDNRRATTQFGQLGQQQSSNPFARPNQYTGERFPSRWA
ncbi:hypothetical protein GE09DRAFT_1217089 [Coniochaeta sp. 2T2.1]|nr:hypothetical protein GE09DRAFT_1217089 [Coniochaeta sp. 2T2.1]